MSLEDLSIGMTKEVSPSDSQFWGVNPEASSNYEKLGKGEITADYTKPDESSVASINTADAISELNKDKEKLDNLMITPDNMVRNPETGDLRPATDAELKAAGKTAPTTDTNLSFSEAYELFGDDFSGVTKNQDGTFTPSSSAYARIGITGMEDTSGNQLSSDLQELDNALTELSNNFLNYNVANDPDYKTEAENITQQYEKMRARMETINNSRKQALQTLGYRTGSTQYAGAIQLGIVGEELKQGSERIAEINRQESAAKSAARKAYKDQKYSEFAQKMDAIDKLRDNKAEELTRHNEKLAEANKLLSEQADREFEITKFLSDQGWKEKQFNLDYAKFKQSTYEFSQNLDLDYDKLNLNFSQFQEDIRQFGESNALDKLKLEIEQSDNQVDRQIKFQTLLNSIPEGEEVTIGGMTGIGRKTDALSISEQLSLMKEGMVIGADGKPVKLPNFAAIDSARDKIDSLDSLLDLPGLSAAVGPNVLARNNYDFDEWINSNTANFVAEVNQLISQESLDSLIAAKARGATFGALSDNEMNILRSAATKLADLEVTSINPLNWGTVIGYDMTEKQFKEEISKFKESAKNVLAYAEMEKTDYTKNYRQFLDFASEYLPEYSEAIENLISQDYSDEDIYNYIRTDKGAEPLDFSSGGGGTPTASEMRTDRHNNPTALMWTPGVEKFFKDKGYNVSKGDIFPEGGNYSLDMSNVDNPVEATIDYINNYGFYYNGQQRWSHTAMNASEWNKLSYAKKKDVVKKMYSAEGNKGLLNKYFA